METLSRIHTIPCKEIHDPQVLVKYNEECLAVYLKLKQQIKREFAFEVTEDYIRRVAYCKFKGFGRHVIIDFPECTRTYDNLYEWINLPYQMYWFK